MKWNPHRQCSWPPEDVAVEKFRTHVKDAALSLNFLLSAAQIATGSLSMTLNSVTNTGTNHMHNVALLLRRRRLRSSTCGGSNGRSGRSRRDSCRRARRCLISTLRRRQTIGSFIRTQRSRHLCMWSARRSRRHSRRRRQPRAHRSRKGMLFRRRLGSCRGISRRTKPSRMQQRIRNGCRRLRWTST